MECFAVRLLHRWRAFWARRKEKLGVDDNAVAPLAQDAGIRVTKISLPSGRVVTIINRHADE
jgi:hypothetical protein